MVEAIYRVNPETGCGWFVIHEIDGLGTGQGARILYAFPTALVSDEIDIGSRAHLFEPDGPLESDLDDCLESRKVTTGKGKGPRRE